jgi:hypothetical protein
MVSNASTSFLRLPTGSSSFFLKNNPTNRRGSTWRVRWRISQTILQFVSKTSTESSKGSLAHSRQSFITSPTCSATS